MERSVGLKTISLRDVLFMLFAKLHVLLGTLLVIVGLMIGHVLTAEPVYEVSSTILIKPIIDSRNTLHVANRLEVSPVSEMDINSEIKIMLSRELLQKVVRDLDLVEETRPSAVKRLLIYLGISQIAHPEEVAIRNLEDQITVEPITLSNMIRATIRGKDPEKITRILRHYLEGYVDRHIEVHKTGGGPQFFAHQAIVYEHKLLEAEDRLKAFQDRWSIVETKGQKEHAMWLLRLLRKSHSEIRGRIAEQKGKLEQLETVVEQRGEVVAMPVEFRTSTVITDLIKAMVPLLVEKERIAQLYPISTPEYRGVASQLERFQEQIELEKNRILNGMRFDFNAALEHEKTVAAEIQKVQQELKLLAEKEIEREKLVREVDRYKENLKLYLAKAEEFRIGEQRDRARVANVAIASAPQEPSMPVYPRRTLMVAAAVLMGGIIGLGAAFGAYYLDQTIKQPDDLARTCDVPVLSSMNLIES